MIGQPEPTKRKRGSEEGKNGKREGGERKEGRLYSAPRSHAQIIVNAAQKPSRLDIRLGKRKGQFRTDPLVRSLSALTSKLPF